MEEASSPVVTVVVIVVVLALVVGVWLLVRHFAAKERARQAAWAAQQGWQFVARDDSLVHLWVRDPFGNGRSRRASNVMTGMYRGYPIRSFGYQYTVDRGMGKDKESTTYRFHVMTVGLPHQLPFFAMSRENAVSRLAGKLGLRDIQFESPDFNRAWHVQAADERYAYGIVTGQFMEWAMRPGLEDFSVVLENADVMTTYQGKPRLEVILPTLDSMVELIERVPRHVWEDYGR